MRTSPLVDALRDRTAAAGHAGATLADLLPAVAGLVPPDQERAAKARLARAGQDPANARRRVVLDRLNVLVRRGELDARGEGDARRYFPTEALQVPTAMFARPKPTREVVPLERLSFDVAHQQRSNLGPAGYDPKAAEEYAERIRDGAEFPPVRVVKDGLTYWVIGGWHTAKALQLVGRNSAECVVYAGTHDDAVLWSLCENGDESVLPRTTADKQKALTRLFDSKKLLARVLDTASDEGGVHRAIAQACGVSKGMVYEALKRRGLKVTRGGRVVKAEPPPEPTTAAAEDDASPGAGEGVCDGGHDADDTPEAADPADAPPDPLPAHVRTALAEGPKYAATIQKLTAALKDLDALCRGPAGVHLLKQIHPNGDPFVGRLKVKRGQVVSEVHTVLPLVALVRLLKRVAPAKACHACRGKDDGCRYCRGAGYLTADGGKTPTAGKTPDIFDGSDIRDAWDS